MPPNDPSNVHNLSDYRQSLADPQTDSLKTCGTGGTSGGMDGWQASVETRLGELRSEIMAQRVDARSDFKQLFGAIIVVALGLAGLMAKGFHWL
jgi:hypothetical protein